MQNPWSAEYYRGDWSDGSDFWTDEFKLEAGWTSADDGVFFMSFEDYYSQCSETFFNYDITDWDSTSFLMLNDDASNPDYSGSPGSFRWCGGSCTRHTLTLTSSVDQDVYLTAHTWDARNMADECENWNSGLVHSIDVTGAQWVMTFKYGATQQEPISMTAGNSI